MCRPIITANTQRFTWKLEIEKRRERGRFYFSPKELQAEISGSVIIDTLGFFVKQPLLIGEGDVFIPA